MKKRIDYIKPLLLPMLLILIWEITYKVANVLGMISGKFVIFPPPFTVFKRLQEMIFDKEILLALGKTILTSVLGISLGIIGAIIVGVLLGGTREFKKYLGPSIHFLRTLPVITYVPIALVIFGSNIRSPVFLAGFVTTLYGALPISHAVSDYDHEKILFLRFRGVNASRIAIGYILPEIVTALTASLSVIITLAVAICVVAEMLLPSLGGIGFWLIKTKETSDYEGLWACTVFLGIAGYILHTIITGLWRYATPWSDIQNLHGGN